MRSLMTTLPLVFRARKLRFRDGQVRKFLPGKLVAPVPEGPFGELHDVALVHQRHRLAAVVYGVSDRASNQPLGPGLAHGFDADAGIRGNSNAELGLQDRDEPPGLVTVPLPFDAGVDVLHILAKDHHIHPLRVTHG